MSRVISPRTSCQRTSRWAASRWSTSAGVLAKNGGNVASYFCTPDGRVIHAVTGPVPARRATGRRTMGSGCLVWRQGPG